MVFQLYTTMNIQFKILLCFKKHTLFAEMYIYGVLDNFCNPMIPCWRYFMLFLTGSATRHECGGSDRQARPAQPEQPLVVHPGHLRHQRRRPLRGARLAVPHTKEQQANHWEKGEIMIKNNSTCKMCVSGSGIMGERGLNGHKEASGLVLENKPAEHPTFCVLTVSFLYYPWAVNRITSSYMKW